MIKEAFVPERKTKHIILNTELVVVGGGLAGCCAAIAAARAGTKVVLMNDRPVLGGNASSEVRLWILGATSHMGNNNRWAREGGIVDEILVENTYRNPEGNPVIFDTVLLDKVISEENITLLLNTAVYSVEKSNETKITSVTGFCSQNSTTYTLAAPYFCDSSGDGIVGFLSGAAFRIGAESKDEFGELFVPSEEYGELLGHSLYFYSKDAGRPVNFVAPSYALKDITKIPRYRNFKVSEDGCRLWWIEYGGRRDTVHDTEMIKWELWKVVYGVWDHIKNSGQFEDVDNLTLEWVGTIPGKRESRRFEGEYMLRQQDLVEQRHHDDAVAFGGWALDLHPSDGVYSDQAGCNQYHSKGVYTIPYRCLYSKNISNLFLAGRIISASHVAFSSTRVMGTCGTTGQAVGTAASICIRQGLMPADLLESGRMQHLQAELIRSGCYIPEVASFSNGDLVSQARISASSELTLKELPFDGNWIPLDYSVAQMLPVSGTVPGITASLFSETEKWFDIELRASSKPFNHTPDVTLEKQHVLLKKGINEVSISFTSIVSEIQYVFICFMKNENVSFKNSLLMVSGLLTVFNGVNKAVSNYGAQQPPEGSGFEAFEFWCPKRRPDGLNLAMKLTSPLACFTADKVSNGTDRPVRQPNAWVADLKDKTPSLRIIWEKPQLIQKVVISFDTDFDHPMESTLMGHPERVMPFCVRNYRLKDGDGKILYEKKGNYQSLNQILWDTPIELEQLIIEVEHPSENIPAAIFGVKCFG